MHVIVISIHDLILTSGIRARLFFFFGHPLQESLTIEWESNSQVGAMVDEGKLRVDRFNGHNFQLWKMQMEDYLYQKDLWKLLEGKIKNQASMTNYDYDLLDRKALGSIRLCLAPSVALILQKQRQ